jgi:hypothetical protein
MIEMVIAALLVINIFVVLLVFSSYRDLQNVKLLNQQTHAAMGTLVGRLLNMEQVMGRVIGGLTELINFTETIMDKVEFDVAQEYRTIDGKYSARSVDELMDKMQRDKEGDTDDFMGNLRNLFENPDDDDDDEDEDDEE